MFRLLRRDNSHTQALRNPALEHELAERDITQFINLVLEATRTSSCTVVLTVRADFYGEFLKHGLLAAAVPPGQVNLGPLSREGLAAAIRKSAEAVGLTVDPPLLEDEVCNDLGKLPLLEYALKETWRRREGQRRRRCINRAGRLADGFLERLPPDVRVQTPPVSGRDHPALRPLVLPLRHQLPVAACNDKRSDARFQRQFRRTFSETEGGLRRTLVETQRTLCETDAR